MTDHFGHFELLTTEPVPGTGTARLSLHFSVIVLAECLIDRFEVIAIGRFHLFFPRSIVEAQVAYSVGTLCLR